MKGFAQTQIFVAFISFACANELPLDFVDDFVGHFGMTDVTFVFGEDNMPFASEIFLNLSNIVSCKLINYSGPEFITEAVNAIMDVEITSSNSAIFFIGNDQLPLLSEVDALDFFKKDIICMIDYRLISVSLKWRLDTKVFFYDVKSMNDVAVSEKYAIKGGQPIVRVVCSWTSEIGFRGIENNLNNVNDARGVYISESLKRTFWSSLRSDLMGVTLVNAALEFPREVYFVRDANGNIIGSTGYLQEILQALQVALNFTVVTTTPADGKYGALGADNKTWNGMIGLLDRKDADIVTSPMARTMARSMVADFTFPVSQDRLTLIAKQRSSALPNIWVYLSVFSPFAWLCIATLLILTGIILTLTRSFDSNSSASISSTLSTCYKMLLQISFDLATHFASSRVLIIVGSLYTYLMFVLYTADMTANMTIRPNKIPVRNFHDVLEHGFQVYVWEDAVAHQVLASATPGSAMHEVYYETMHHHPEVLFTGTGRQSEILVDNPKALLFGYGVTSSYSIKDSQALVIDEMSRVYGSFATQKDSELTGILR